MKKNTLNPTTPTTTPVLPESTVTAAAAAAMLDKADDIMAMAREAVKNGMSESDFIKYVSMTYFNNASDLDMLKTIQAEASECYKKVMEEKTAADELMVYQNMSNLDRILLQITEPMIDYGDSAMAGLIQALLTEQASKVKIGYEIGRNSNNKKMINDLEYIVRALKMEPATSGPWANKLIEIYNELFK